MAREHLLSRLVKVLSPFLDFAGRGMARALMMWSVLPLPHSATSVPLRRTQISKTGGRTGLGLN